MIIGTAGHIDHGKSTLVTALTGRAMDRLAEEQRRQITIELNFAPVDLGGGRMAGIVDVPGHEDFVRTMVAGASGIDLALLVVAADEGIMPQTEEHLAILEQLNVAAGIPVITKSDLVDPEWLQLVTLEVSERLSRSRLAFEPPLPVSARIDRVFSRAGIGTVVTGTAWSGSLSVGESVVALPSAGRGRVRSLESYGRALERSQPGARTAVGIAGMDRSALTRGEMLVTEELPWSPTTALDVEIMLQSGARRPLSSRTRVRLLLGTAEVMARVLPRGPIDPGGTGMARLSLESPLLARAEDRFVLRSYSPVTTIGGGRVLDPAPPRRRTLWSPELASNDPAGRFRGILARRPLGLPAAALPILLGVPRSAASALARREPSARLVGDLWVTSAAVEQLGLRALRLLREYHRRHPSLPGMPLETLRHSLRAPGPMVEAALEDFARGGRLRRSHSLVALAGFTPRVAGGDAEIDRVVAILFEAQLSPPSVAELERSTGHRDVMPLLRLAAATGRVEAVERDRFYTREALEKFTDVLHDLGHQGPIVPGQVRDRLGISRKYLIPLLEWADGKGITVREGEGRRLKAKV
jgi:selenocysteine-specific elongation factor